MKTKVRGATAARGISRPAGRALAVLDRTAMLEALTAFVEHYLTTHLDYLATIPGHTVEPVVKALITALTTERNTVYAFGNGGSHAIARHLEQELKHHFAEACGLRVNCAVNYHLFQPTTTAEGFGAVFEAVLRAERAHATDLGILISGSGDSDNVVRAAAYCRAHGVPTISFAGFDGGKISRDGATDLPIVVRVHDQQISEDIMQALLHVIVEHAHRRYRGEAVTFEDSLERYATRLGASLRRIRPATIECISGSICRAFVAGHAVFVLAPEGGALSVSAEHIAHNLNWDAVFQVQNPPRRRLYSTPTSCDYSGIANDRLMPGVASCQQLDLAEPGDVLVLFAYDVEAAAVQHALGKARAAGMTVHVLAGRGGAAEPDDTLVFETTDAAVLGDCSQVVGHLLGRTVRLRLKQAMEPDTDLGDLTTYLIKGDLAQRRLIKVVHGV